MQIFHIWDWNVCVCLYLIPTDWRWSLLSSWVGAGCCLLSDRKMLAASSPLASKISRTFLVLARGPGRHSTSSRSSRPKSSCCSKASNKVSILSSSSSTKETRSCLKTIKQDAQAFSSTMTDVGPPSSSQHAPNLPWCFLRGLLGVHVRHWQSVLRMTAGRKLALSNKMLFFLFMWEIDPPTGQFCCTLCGGPSCAQWKKRLKTPRGKRWCVWFLFISWSISCHQRKQVGRSAWTHQWMRLFTKLCTRTCMEINSWTGEEKTSIYTA